MMVETGMDTVGGHPRLEPFALRDAPALIEAVFPAQKISFEAQRERKAGAGQTLTALGSYWKGRKPLILVRAILLGSLLPRTDDPEQDLEIFEQLMAFDTGGLARREPKLSPADVARRITLENPWRYFSTTFKGDTADAQEIEGIQCPFDPDDYPGLALRWRRDIDPAEKLDLLARTLMTFATYEERAGLCKRPEELDRSALYAPIWPAVNAHLGHFGIEAHSHQELVEQLGILRFGHRPKVGDTFCGGGSIPFEAARLGCDVYASDLNPIACMLTWGALNIIGGPQKNREQLTRDQRELVKHVQHEIDALGFENNATGWVAKVFLYCVEITCPETGWLVPLLPSRIISTISSTIADLVPDYSNKRYAIVVRSHVTGKELQDAENGTIWREGKYGEAHLSHSLNGKTYRARLSTIRGDFRMPDGSTGSKLRIWRNEDFISQPDDLLRDRLYCIQWMRRKAAGKGYYYEFRSVTGDDLGRERQVEKYVGDRIAIWRENGWLPDMDIEVGGPPRYQGADLLKARGWTNWLHVFNPRQLMICGLTRSKITAYTSLDFAVMLNCGSKLSRWHAARDYVAETFDNQALNTLFNYSTQSFSYASRYFNDRLASVEFTKTNRELNSKPACEVFYESDLYITDPPYADAVMYHEITDFFIAWLRKNPPPPFDQWTWDSRRDLAIKGSGDDFRRGMVDAYKAMTEHMPDNGMQCVMFTHQDTGVWSDMVSIFWAAGLQVVGAWYIATETTSELKKGGYVQGTVILMLRKRPAGERPGFKQRILPEVKREVDAQIKQMLHLNTETDARMGAPVFNDSDLQMAGYAAALKVLTGYTSLGGEDVTAFALRPRRKGETTVVDEIVEQAAETANGLLVPEGLERETWQAIGGIQRFYLRMLDMETTGASKLDNYQNFAKAFRVDDYAAVMASTKPNAARLKSVTEFKSRDLTDRTELGATPLAALVIAVQEFLADKDPEVVMANLRDAIPDYLHRRPLLIDMTAFIAAKARGPAIRRAAEAIASRMRNQRLQ